MKNKSILESSNLSSSKQNIDYKINTDILIIDGGITGAFIIFFKKLLRQSYINR